MSLRSSLFLLGSVLAACASPAGPDTVEFEQETAWPEHSLLPPSTGLRLAVTNSGDDTVSIIDAASFTESARLPVGLFPIGLEVPNHLQASSDGRHLFVGLSNVAQAVTSGPHGSHVPGSTPGYLLKLDAITGHEVDRVRVGRSPGELRFHPDGKRLIQSHFDLVGVSEGVDAGVSERTDSLLLVVEASTMKKTVQLPVCPAGQGVDFSSDGRSVYLACYMSDELAVVDIDARTVERISLGPDAAQPPLAVYQPYALSVSPLDGTVWVGATGPDHKGLRIVNPANEAGQVRELPTPGVPYFGDFSQSGLRFLVPTRAPDRLLEIDPNTDAVARDIDLAAVGCRNPRATRFSPDESALFVVCEGERGSTPGRLLQLDSGSLEVVGSLELGLEPRDLAFIPPVGSGA